VTFVRSRPGSGSRVARAKRLSLAAVALIAAVPLVIQIAVHGFDLGASHGCAGRDSWTSPQVKLARDEFLYRPRSDKAAAACVAHTSEAIPANRSANDYVPSDSELRTFLSARNQNGETPEQYDFYAKFVTGRPGLRNPTTDELIQWASYKWGIPTDWLRAQYAKESHWRQDSMGDLHKERPRWRSQFPRLSCPNASECYESLGIAQVKWHPWNDEGTEPLRWKSTAFNIDYQAAKLRFYYDNPYGKRSAWGDSSYRPLDQWLSLCGWFAPYPWGNPAQLSYCSKVKQHLAARDWPH
jgi:hypothetical protein